MKSLHTCVCLIIFACAASAHGQSAPAHRTNRQIVDFILTFQEKRVTDVADAMPEDKYDFAPTQGEFTGVRTFRDELKHIAADNYLLGAGILGEKSPGNTTPGENGAITVRTKREVIAYLRASFAYMHRAVATVDDDNAVIATPSISPWPNGTATRMGVAVEDCLHTWDHYGQLVEYLRMNGIVPPASRR